MERGLAGTSIDMILDAAGITKGAFFYHFKSKADLAEQLAKRYVNQDNNAFLALMREAERTTSDPLDCLIDFLDRLGEWFGKSEPLPGSLFASYCYGQHDEKLASFMDEHMKLWRKHYVRLFQRIAQRYPPAGEIDLTDLSDHFLTVVQGGFVMSRIYRDPSTVATQLRLFGRYVQLVFPKPQPA